MNMNKNKVEEKEIAEIKEKLLAAKTARKNGVPGYSIEELQAALLEILK